MTVLNASLFKIFIPFTVFGGLKEVEVTEIVSIFHAKTKLSPQRFLSSVTASLCKWYSILVPSLPRSVEFSNNGGNVGTRNALSFACFYAVMAADVLQRFHPDVAKFVEAVLNTGGMGVCGELPKIIEPKTR